MMIKQSKRQAKKILKKLPGKYTLFVLPFILALVNTSITYKNHIAPNLEATFISNFFPLLITFLLSFFTISTLYVMLEVIRKKRETVEFGDVTFSLSKPFFTRLFITLLVKNIFLFLWGLISIVGVTIGASVVALSVSKNPSFSPSLFDWIFIILGIVISILGFIISIIKSLQYEQITFVLYDQVKENRYQGPLGVIRESKRLMKNHLGQLFLLYLSFIGWFLLVIVTFGIAYIYVLPYIVTTRAIYYEHLREQDSSGII